VQHARGARQKVYADLACNVLIHVTVPALGLSATHWCARAARPAPGPASAAPRRAPPPAASPTCPPEHVHCHQRGVLSRVVAATCAARLRSCAGIGLGLVKELPAAATGWRPCSAPRPANRPATCVAWHRVDSE